MSTESPTQLGVLILVLECSPHPCSADKGTRLFVSHDESSNYKCYYYKVCSSSRYNQTISPSPLEHHNIPFTMAIITKKPTATTVKPLTTVAHTSGTAAVTSIQRITMASTHASTSTIIATAGHGRFHLSTASIVGMAGEFLFVHKPYLSKLIGPHLL